jgi:acetyltransferase-like isoleucine patch superfamily enzyme
VKYFKIIIEELNYFLKFIIIYAPNSHILNRIRKYYWQSVLKIKNVYLIGRGAEIVSPDNIFIGENFVLEENSVIHNANARGIYIGDNVGIARLTFIRTSNHKVTDADIKWNESGYDFKSIEYKGSKYSIIIEDEVWIGAHCIILTGAFIGKGSVISAGSVVTKDVPQYAIAAGNPAKVLRYRT